jgi:hypothetical protein
MKILLVKYLHNPYDVRTETGAQTNFYSINDPYAGIKPAGM